MLWFWGSFWWKEFYSMLCIKIFYCWSCNFCWVYQKQRSVFRHLKGLNYAKFIKTEQQYYGILHFILRRHFCNQIVVNDNILRVLGWIIMDMHKYHQLNWYVKTRRSSVKCGVVWIPVGIKKNDYCYGSEGRLYSFQFRVNHQSCWTEIGCLLWWCLLHLLRF